MQGPRMQVSWLQAVGVYSALFALWVAGTRIAGLTIRWASAEIIGWSLSVLALLGMAAQGIDSGRIRSGTELNADDMCKSFRRARSVYIGVLAAEGRKPQAFILKMARQRIQALNLTDRHAAVYGKPATRHGARLLRKYGFAAIPGNESICRADYQSLLERL